MSHPVFLESPPWPRMPEGRKGELPAYYGSGGPSLVANAAIPLLWQAMFGPGDIRYAAVIDDFDPVEGAVELEEFLEDATPSELEATYPYLVASRDSALARLEARRERLIDLIGERYRPVYQAFSDHVRDHYGDYVLVRTSGLPDIEDATGWMTSMLADMEVMEHADAPVPAGLAHEAVEDALGLALDTGGCRVCTGRGMVACQAQAREIAEPVLSHLASSSSNWASACASLDGAVARPIIGKPCRQSLGRRLVAPGL
ncbi:hypothetical protein [Pseudomonas sp. Hp2]|uniref:hypothetical protein n=1 Tax=Pseudomonas sp. Hp2 TaxID=701189 RepID=UPI00112CDC64|nr:hypothetical protein [Pseudomonas sp. Hp2]